jgi:hypothetical protein
VGVYVFFLHLGEKYWTVLKDANRVLRKRRLQFAFRLGCGGHGRVHGNEEACPKLLTYII